MPSINSAQLDDVTFITGVDAQGLIAHGTFWDWNGNFPASYGRDSDEAKWGATTAGTGATISVAFEAASNWTASEQQVFVAAMDLWSAVANVKFTVTTNPNAASVMIDRASDGTASGGIESLYPGSEGSAHLGRASSGSVDIDSSVNGFGPIDGSFATAGGYVWMTIEHELGHVLGLGHAGAYNSTGSDADQTPQYNGYDTRAWSIMSYVDVNDHDYPNSVEPTAGFYWGQSGNALTGVYNDVPTTLMPLDIVAAQRLYGVATNSPLSSGGQVFGFHTNIQGDIAQFFDFNVNTKPVITIWDGGLNNTLDVSGFAQAATLSLEAGTFSSVGGLVDNIAIAFGTHIDNAVGGSANDTINGNNNNDILMGGTGADSIIGGTGNDHIFGNMQTTVAGAVDGADFINAGDGANIVNGNAGNDTIRAGDGIDRIQGGQGNDAITIGNAWTQVNGNLGNDTITVGDGTATVRGGQGDDTLHVGAGTDVLMGDLGNDHLYAGTGYDVLTGGDGADMFAFASGTSAVGHAIYDEVTDFTDGVDRIMLQISLDDAHVLHSASAYASVSDALMAARALLASTPAVGEVAALQVGSDTYLFYSNQGQTDSVDSVIHLDHVTAAQITASDFLPYS